MGKHDKNANYDPDKRTPQKRMGEDGFANLPREAIMRDFSKKMGYRDGLVNDFDSSIEEISGIPENRR